MIHPSRAGAHAIVDLLVAERPSFHGGTGAVGAVNWQAGDGLLRWLAGEVPLGGRTLETGCGYSTALFAALSGHHTVISPFPDEHKRVQAWCAEHDLPYEHIQFVADRSDRFLPGALDGDELGELDALFIDGDHAFPVPALDWFYASPAVAVSGLVILDDASIKACTEVVDFLKADTDRWRYETTVDDAAVFRKLVEDAEVREVWRAQPWNRRTPSLDERIRRVADVLRPRRRVRSLLRR